MNEYGWLALYCLLILMFSLGGGGLPFLGRVGHSRLQFYLSASAGVMLGAAFFHIMPEAFELAKENFGWWMALGVVGLFCIERFIAPHSHEMDGGGQHGHGHGHHHHHHEGVCDEHVLHKGLAHDHDPAHGHALAMDHRAAAPSVAGWMAVLGLTIHTFMNGVGLAGAVDAETVDAGHKSLFGLGLPGLAMFLAIFLHKPADALAISMVLSRKGVSRGKITLVQLGFAAMIPLGVVGYYLTKSALKEDLENELTGAALAFSSGTFLFIALSDLLPEVQFHRHDRVPLFLTLILGVGLMGGIAYLEELGHGHSHGAHQEKDHDHGGHDKHKDHDDGDKDDHDRDHRHGHGR
jgi:zinc and cadmium transporter